MNQTIIGAIYLFQYLHHLLWGGGKVVDAQYVGRNDYAKANEATMQGIISTTFISIFIMILLLLFNRPLIQLVYHGVEPQVMEYGITYFSIVLFSFPFMALTLMANGILRGAGDTKIAAISNVVANIFNILLRNYNSNVCSLKADNFKQ